MNMPACFCFRGSAELSRLAWGAALVLQLASPLAGYGAPLGPWPQQSPSLRQHLSQPGRPLWRRLVRRGYRIVGSGVESSSASGEFWTNADVERLGGNRIMAIAGGPTGLVATNGTTQGVFLFDHWRGMGCRRGFAREQCLRGRGLCGRSICCGGGRHCDFY